MPLNEAVRAEIAAQGEAMKPLVEALRPDPRSHKLPKLRAVFNAIWV